MFIIKKHQTFYFADVPDGNGFSSYLTILNPGMNTATVKASYYANGQKVNSQSVTVAGGTRGTIFPAKVAVTLLDIPVCEAGNKIPSHGYSEICLWHGLLLMTLQRIALRGGLTLTSIAEEREEG